MEVLITNPLISSLMRTMMTGQMTQMRLHLALSKPEGRGLCQRQRACAVLSKKPSIG